MSKELKPIEQKEIEFQGEHITAVLVEDTDGRENVYVPLRPLVESMGLNWSGQRQRIKRNPVLDKVCRFVVVTHTNSKGGNPNKLAIPISHLNGFLFGINADRVKPEIRPLIIEYQQKCYQVLFHAFNGTESMRQFYKAVGFDGKWIETRIQKHETSTELADIWLINGVAIEHHDMLQNELNKGTFGVSTAEHRQLKQIAKDAPLKDNMTRLELIMSMYADEANMTLIENEQPQNVDENIQLSTRAGQIAGDARRNFEEQTGRKVLSDKSELDKKRRPSLGDGKK